MAKNDDIGGVWRTVGGRRIFIKDGQDLKTAMKESGKFKTKKIKNQEIEQEQFEKKYNAEEQFKIKKEYEDIKKQLNVKEQEYNTLRAKWRKENYPDLKSGTQEFKDANKEYDIKNKEKFLSDNKKIYEDYDRISKQKEEYFNQLKKEFTRLKKKYPSDANDSYNKHLLEILTKEASGYEEIAKRLLISDGKNFEKYKKFGELAKTRDYIISTSPYGSSMYALEKGEYIDWGHKPMNSYRIADHWGFESRGKIHCKLGKSEEYVSSLEIGEWNGEYYEKI